MAYVEGPIYTRGYLDRTCARFLSYSTLRILTFSLFALRIAPENLRAKGLRGKKTMGERNATDERV